MENNPKQIYTKLFFKHLDPFLLNVYSNQKPYEINAFAYYFHVFEKLDDLPELEKFQIGFNSFLEIKHQEEKALQKFEFETAQLNSGKEEYINETIHYLKNSNNEINTTKLKSLNQYYQFTEPKKARILLFINLIENSLKNILIQISNNNSIYLKKKSKEFIDQIKSPKEYLKSFSLIKNIEAKRFENIYYKHLQGKYVSYSTEVETFKALFLETYPINKINWIRTKSYFCYFINLLRTNKIIKNTKNMHWKIVSQYVLINGEALPSHKFKNQKPPNLKEQRDIETLIDVLKF